jgi:hypothetical protein
MSMIQRAPGLASAFRRRRQQSPRAARTQRIQVENVDARARDAQQAVARQTPQ